MTRTHLLLRALPLLASLPLAAATLTVTDPANAGAGTLRDQVAAANPSDLIVFDAALNGQTISLSTPIVIGIELTIDASALPNQIEISGSSSTNLFTVGAAGDLTLESLILRDGNNGTGGAIDNDGTLTINNSTLRDNTATDGGALHNNGTLTLTNSTLSANTATGNGGALYLNSSPNALITNVTIANNTATVDGGGIYMSNTGRGYLTHVTIAGNEAGVQGGGIRNNPSSYLELRNTIIALNIITGGAESNVSGHVSESGGAWLFGDPELLPLGNYGGPTETMPPDVRSVVIDRGFLYNPLTLPSTDQQGNPRLVKNAGDPGAVEAQPPMFFPVDTATNVAPYGTSLWWIFEPDATSYEIFLGTTSGALTSVGTTTDCELDGLVFQPGVTNFWRIEATTGGSTVSSPELSFTTLAPVMVTILEDEDDGSLGLGNGDSLREAAEAAQAGGGGGMVRFDPILNGKTVVLGGTPITIDEPLAIDASPLSIRINISGDNASNLFTVNFTGDLALESLILRDGNNPEGGAIDNNGTLRFNQCTFRDNAATDGGAIHNGSIVIGANSDLFDNSASNSGGAVYDGPNFVQEIDLTNCTIAGNSAAVNGGAIAVGQRGDVSLLHCTVSANTAPSNSGIWIQSFFGTPGDLALRNSIVGGNLGAFLDISSPTNIDVNFASIVNTDPLLQPLADNGGPTLTMLPLAHSPALDLGFPFTTLPATDQRGNPRVINGTPDAGALEAAPPLYYPLDGTTDVAPNTPLVWFWELGADSYEIFAGTTSGALASLGTTTERELWGQGFSPGATHFWRIEATTGGVTVSSPEFEFTTRPALLVTTAADENDGALGVGTGDSLREVVEVANNAPGGDAIHFHASLDGQTITLTSNILGSGNLMIDAIDLPNGLILSGGDTISPLVLSGEIVLRGVTITDGFDFNYAGLNVGGLVVIRDCTIRDSSSTFDGAGLGVSGKVRIINCAIHDNTANLNGGGIRCVSNTELTIVNSTITGNSAALGAGIMDNSSTITVLNSTITDNSSSSEGGGIWTSTGTINLTNSLLSGNTAPTDPDLHGSIASGSNNFLAGDPLLHPLALNGGRTVNFLPRPDSPLLEAGTDPGGLPLTDQRGGPRVQGGAIDIGPVEVSLPSYEPVNGAGQIPADVTLRWFFEPGADSYEVFFGPDGGPLTSVGTTTTRRLPPGLLTTGQSYQWRIEATTGGSTVSGAVLGFTVRPSPVVTTTADENDGALGLGIGDSLREAIEAANALSGVDTITFAPGLDGQTLTLTAGEFLVTTTLSLNASALPNGLTIDGSTASRILHLSAAGSCTLDSLHLTRGNSPADGGAILNDGALTALRCTISHCAAAGNGGAIAGNGSLLAENSTFANNLALFSGGALDCAGVATLRHTTVSANLAFFGSGGGILNGGTLTIENSIVAANNAITDVNLSGPAPGTLGNNFTSGNPKLAPLANYGPPTPSMPPLPGSPAIEGALLLGSTPPTDQRGNPRPSGPLPDLGAIEASAVAPSAAPLADTDGDKIPDILEGFDGPYPQFTVGIDDSALDTDGDGTTDVQELHDMTDPFNNADFFRILSIATAPGFDGQTNPLVDVTIATFPGFSYEVETDATLQNFQLLPGSQFVATDFTTTIQLPLDPTRDFLRAKRN